MTAGRSWAESRGDLGFRLGRRLRSLEQRGRYRLGLPGMDPGEVDLSRGFCHPVDAAGKALLAARYRELFPEAAAAEVAEARRLAEHRFCLLGQTWQEGDRICWSRDPVTGGEWSRAFSPDIPYRGPQRLGDIKLPWELNKHQYFFTLGKAAWLTGSPGPAEEIVRQIEHWIGDNPCLRGVNWVSALEAGTRAVSWIMAYPFYADRCEAGFTRRLARSLGQHLFFVERNLSRGRFTNTHLAGEAAALVAGGLFLDCRRAPGWVETGLGILEEEMERQVGPDGVHEERSLAYHRFFLDQYHLVAALLARNGRALPPATARGMERMTEALRDLLFPDGGAPAFGDNDDARGLWFHAGCTGDFRSLLALGAALFGRGDFKAAAGAVTEEVLWLHGEDGVAAFGELPALVPGHTSAACAAGGYWAMRGGWGASDPVLVFDCGPLGHGPAGHGHADALSVQLFAGGYPFLVDPGTYSYNLDYRWRDAFRATSAHNTVVVDGEDQSLPGDRMSWTTRAVARSRRWVTTPWFDLADGEHDGYRRLADPVTHRRVVLFFKPDAWCLFDRLEGKGAHEFEAFLHLRPDCAIERPPGGAGVVLRSPAGATLHLGSFSEGGKPRFPDVLSGGDDVPAAWFSPGYGVRTPSRALRIGSRFVGKAALVTWFSTSPEPALTWTESDGANLFDLARGGGRRETLVVPDGPGRERSAAGVRFDGDLLYRREGPGGAEVLWASGFRVLALPGLLEVRATAPVVSLVLQGDRCDIAPAPGTSGGLRVACRGGICCFAGGTPLSTAACAG